MEHLSKETIFKEVFAEIKEVFAEKSFTNKDLDESLIISVQED